MRKTASGMKGTKKPMTGTAGKQVPHTQVGGKPQQNGEPLVKGSTVYGKSYGKPAPVRATPNAPAFTKKKGK